MALPTTEQGLQALVTQPGATRDQVIGISSSEMPKDPWGNNYIYSPGRKNPPATISIPPARIVKPIRGRRLGSVTGLRTPGPRGCLNASYNPLELAPPSALQERLDFWNTPRTLGGGVGSWGIGAAVAAADTGCTASPAAARSAALLDLAGAARIRGGRFQ
jgi:hypothetical protein